MNSRVIVVSGEIADHFTVRSSTYDKKGVWVRDPLVMSATIDFLDIAPSMRVIDIGSGTGAVLENCFPSAEVAQDEAFGKGRGSSVFLHAGKHLKSAILAP